MIGEILAYLRNYFVQEIYSGDFAIEEGKISGVPIAPNQYYRVVGSVYNDGVYINDPAESELTDEIFSGAVWALAVPPDLIKLSKEIEDYIAKDTVSSYTSESWGGYSYTKRTENGAPISWQGVFRSRLARWRKL